MTASARVSFVKENCNSKWCTWRCCERSVSSCVLFVPQQTHYLEPLAKDESSVVADLEAVVLIREDIVLRVTNRGESEGMLNAADRLIMLGGSCNNLVFSLALILGLCFLATLCYLANSWRLLCVRK